MANCPFNSVYNQIGLNTKMSKYTVSFVYIIKVNFVLQCATCQCTPTYKTGFNISDKNINK